jgi:hypothetical protein
MNKEDYENRVKELEEREKRYQDEVTKVKSAADEKMRKLAQKIQALEITVDMLSMRISARMPKE